MGYIKASGVADDVPANVPLIGYNNSVNTANVSSTTAAAGFPITNAANSATHLKWKATAVGDELITIATGMRTNVDYVGIAGHNFGSAQVRVALEVQDPSQVLLHFNDLGFSPDVIIDNNANGSSHTWTRAGDATQDATERKFGVSSLKCDGTGDYVSTPDSADFTLGDSDFTIDLWFECTTLTGTTRYLAGQVDAAGGANANSAWFISHEPSNFMTANVTQGTTMFTITGNVQYTNLLNTGWHHIAFVRTGSTLKMFIDGVQQGGDLTFTGKVNDSAAALGVGALGNFTSSPWLGWIDEFRMTVGVARWTANFTPPKAPSGWTTLLTDSIDDNSTILLHFDGANASTSISDSNAVGSLHTWTAAGNAQIATDASKFGSSSLKLDGTGDYITTPNSSEFDVGTQDFTIDAWFNVNGGAGSFRWLCGQGDGFTGRSPSLFLTSSNKMRGAIYNDDGETSIDSTTSFTTNGWHHVAWVRTGNTLKLFIDGVQEGGDVTFTGAADASPTVYGVGVEGNRTSSTWNGWIDEFRLTVGTARWTANFTPPTSAYNSASVVTDDNPIVLRWTPQPIGNLRLHLRSVGAGQPPQIAVLYFGKLLILERSITIGQKHVPITYGRKTSVVNGMSETGNFTGRIVLGEHRESKAEFEWFTPSFYRLGSTANILAGANITLDNFLDAAQESPFFWVWNPRDYPKEVGYVWLSNDAQPETDPATGRIGLTLEMRGIA